jgi:hypothetical protein
MTAKYKKAIETINQKGILLVFPINNNKEPASLWSQFYPRSKMEWNWDNGADNRVGEMWGLMKKLSDCGEVIYSKWYQGRATFFSRKVFTALLRLRSENIQNNLGLNRTSLNLLEILESDSPLSTKQLKKMAELQGKDNEKFYQRAMKQLFKNFHIVAFGEVDDGAFPSLAIGSTKNLYEALWNESQLLSEAQAMKTLQAFMPEGELFRKYLDKA